MFVLGAASADLGRWAAPPVAAFTKLLMLIMAATLTFMTPAL